MTNQTLPIFCGRSRFCNRGSTPHAVALPCWGLVSFRLKPDQKQPYSTINARDDRIQTAPHFQPRAEPFAFAGFGTSEC